MFRLITLLEENKNKVVLTLFAIDILVRIRYNNTTPIFSYGLVRVSTGISRYDKRGGLDNPVIMSKLKNKRQQFCCSCSVSCDAAISAARTVDEDYGFHRASNLVVNLNRDFALVSVRH